MKSHFFEDSDEAVSPRETASDACVREHRVTATGSDSDILLAAAAVVMVILLLVYMFSGSEQPNGEQARSLPSHARVVPDVRQQSTAEPTAESRDELDRTLR